MAHLKEFFLYQWHGAAVWFWLLTLVVLPVLNEVVSRTKKVTAGSLLQSIGDSIKKSPLYMVPGLKQIIDVLATPKPPDLSGAAPALAPLAPDTDKQS